MNHSLFWIDEKECLVQSVVCQLFEAVVEGMQKPLVFNPLLDVFVLSLIKELHFIDVESFELVGLHPISVMDAIVYLAGLLVVEARDLIEINSALDDTDES